MRTVGIVASLILLVALTAAALAQPKDTPEDRRVAAQRYLAAVPLDQMFADAIHEIGKRLPDAERKNFFQLTNQLLQSDRLERFMLDSMVKHFTAAELDALARFYGSAEGRSVLKKFGPYMADTLPYLLREFEQVAEKSKRGR